MRLYYADDSEDARDIVAGTLALGGYEDFHFAVSGPIFSRNSASTRPARMHPTPTSSSCISACPASTASKLARRRAPIGIFPY